MNQAPLILGLDTFGDVTHDEQDRRLSDAQTIRNVVEQGVLAEQAGADFFGIGEHHIFSGIRPSTRCPAAGPKLSSAGLEHRLVPAVRLRPGRLRRPVRGEGRAVRRTSDGRTGHLAGQDRAPLYSQDVVPHTEHGPFPAWIGVGGSPQSVIRAARYGYSLMLAIIGGSPARFAPFSQLFQQALERFGRPPLPVGVHAPGHVAATDEQAREEFWPRYRDVIASVAKTRGFVIPTPDSFLREVGPAGALYVGSPQTVAQKIAANLTVLGASRFDLKYGMGGLSHQALMTNIELYGTQVIPRVRELLA